MGGEQKSRFATRKYLDLHDERERTRSLSPSETKTSFGQVIVVFLGLDLRVATLGNVGLKRRRGEGEGEKEKEKEIATLVDTELEQEWARHEEEVYKYLQSRNRINEQMELLTHNHTHHTHLPHNLSTPLSPHSNHSSHTQTHTHSRYRQSFESYWNTHCHTMSHCTLLCFYLGTSLMLLATLVYECACFLYSYHSTVSMLVSLVTLGVSLVVCLGLAVYLRFYEVAHTHKPQRRHSHNRPHSGTHTNHDTECVGNVSVHSHGDVSESTHSSSRPKEL